MEEGESLEEDIIMEAVLEDTGTRGIIEGVLVRLGEGGEVKRMSYRKG